MIIAIGDIHGQWDKFTKLIDNLRDAGYDLFKPQHLYVQLGDIVDGGPDSKKLIDFFKLYDNIQVLKGNHEDMLLDAVIGKSQIYGDFRQWWDQGGKQTALSYKSPTSIQEIKSRPYHVFWKEDIEWLKKRPLFMQTKNFIFVHAGLRPNVALEDQTTEDMLWIRETFIRSDHDFGKRVVYGHTFTQYPTIHKRNIGIDTMHFGRGPLTAVILNDVTGEVMDVITDGEEPHVAYRDWK